MIKVFLFVALDVKSGKYDEFVAALSKHISIIRTEAGCEFIDIYRDIKKKNVVNVWEIWSDRTAWEAHMVNENSKSWQAAASKLVFGESITVMDQLS